MSMADAQRFAKDLATKKELAETVKAKAAGLASLVDLGRANGYSFTADELKQVIRGAAKRDLTDDQLEAVAGGQGAQVATQTVSLVDTNVSSNAQVVITVLDYTQTQAAAQVVTVVA